MTFDKKEYMKEYMKIYRAKSKEIIPLWTTNNYKLSEKTIKQYVDIIMRIARKLLPFTPRDLEESLKNVFNGNKKQSDYDSINQKFKHFINKNFIKKIEEMYPNKVSQKVNMIPFVRILSMLPQKKYRYYHQLLSEHIIKLNKEYEHDRDNNELSDDEKDKMITDFKEETILNNMKKLHRLEDKMIYGLYTLLPPRRLEYSNVIIATKSQKLNDKNNYLIKDKKKPIKFVFNDYKTSKTFKTQTIDIPESLSEVISNYILFTKKKTGEFLLDYTTNTFSKKLVKVFSEVYGNRITLNYIRKSYATYIHGLNLSNNQLKEIAYMMSHNLEQSMKYRKLL